MEKNGLLPIGKVVGVHGVSGTVKVYSYATSEAVFKPKSFLRLRCSAGEICRYTIRWIKPHNRVLLVSLHEICNRRQAEALVGSLILMDKTALPELEDGAYYWADIIGLSVYSARQEYIGQVTSIIPTGSNDVYVVKKNHPNDGEDLLIPALESVVLAIDLEKKMMQVDLPEGL